ncbi:TonB-dependent receptor [Saccharicrinis sp. 156]|uniref:TonB-dependent receptor n=1 Tax=Saccharicrinis sp. 156 TaxID=3417574 RepID=UPI003D32AE03
MKHINKISLLAISVLGTLSVNGQELNKDVKVVREYNPIISDAYKINELPVNEVDEASFDPNFSYNILSKAMSAGLAVEPISAARLTPERKTVLDKSYVKGGLGNYVTLFGELNYNLLRSEEFAVGLNLGHISSGGDVKLEDDSKVDAPFHDTWASVYFRRFWKDYTLSIDADFLHNIYHYYGYQNLDETIDYYGYPYSMTPVLGEDLMVDERQRLSSFDLTVGLNNKVLDDSATPFDANFTFGTFSNVTGVKENHFGLNGKVRGFINDMFIDVIGGFDYYGTSVPDSISPLYQFLDRNMTVVNLSPALGFQFEGANVKVGLDIFAQLGGQDDDFNVAPHLEADLEIAEGIVTAFAGIKGDYYVNNYERVQRENRFVSADQNVKNSFHGIHLFGGLRGNFSSQTSFTARLDYSTFDNEHFFVNRSYSDTSPLSSASGQMYQSNIFDVVYDDGNLLSVSGELKYEPSSGFNLLLKGKYNGWNMDNLKQAWHKPEMELGVSANYELMEDLWVNLGLYSIGRRYALDVTNGSEKELKGVVDLNLGVNYYMSSKWTLFANVNNLLIAKYYQYNGYPLQGLNMRAGVGYSF